jgi:hypothetical protein
MSKSLSATRSRAPTSSGSEIAPANQVEVEGFEAATTTTAAPAAPRRKPHRVTALPPLISNLGEPVGIFAWEREFLLAIAAEVLKDFEEADDETAE